MALLFTGSGAGWLVRNCKLYFNRLLGMIEEYNLDLNRKSVIIFFVYYYLRKEQTIMNIDDLVEIYECPLCGGAGILEEDCGSSYYVTCLECGCHSVNIDFKSDEDRLDAAKRTADLWNCGKVISMSPGE